MLQELSFEEIATINGGQITPYEIGHSVGKAVSAFISAYGMYGLILAAL